MAKLGFELSLGLTGVMTLWLGIMKIGEKGGAVNYLSKVISPLFNKLFPDIPKKSFRTRFNGYESGCKHART